MLGILIVVFCAILGYRQRTWDEFIAVEAFRVAISVFQTFAIGWPVEGLLLGLAVYGTLDVTAFLVARHIGGRRNRAA